jgi:hypothetical protein
MPPGRGDHRKCRIETPFKLANINSHMTTFGYMLPTPPDDILDVIFQVFSRLGEEGAVDTSGPTIGP